jgi:diphthine synthase
MFYLIGLGLGENDLPLHAVETIKKCDKIFYEFYTNKWHGSIDQIKKITGKNIEMLKREQTESNFLINEAKKNNVALLVGGDPLTATTHMELFIEAKKNKIPVEVIHASSVYTAVAETGLQIYKFGRTTTLTSEYKPASPFDIIKENKKRGLHTLILLDTKNGEKYMTIKEGLEILLDIIKPDTKVVICCALGSKDQIIKYAKVLRLIKENPKQTPASIIVTGDLHFKEDEALKLWE